MVLPFPHTNRFIIISSLAVLSYMTGVILPYSSIQERIVLQKVQHINASRPEEIGRIAQIMKEQIQHEKASPQVLAAQSSTKPEEWGVAKQIGEHTWTMQVSSDEKVGTVQEILQALNNYRQRHGRGILSWDTNLGNFAQGRADMFLRNGTTDAHAGFTDFMNNQDGFKKSGFMALGENSSFGYHVEGVHLIEWIYAGDVPHNNNQLNAEWTHVGVGVAGLATDLVFGGRKM